MPPVTVALKDMSYVLSSDYRHIAVDSNFSAIDKGEVEYEIISAVRKRLPFVSTIPVIGVIDIFIYFVTVSVEYCNRNIF